MILFCHSVAPISFTLSVCLSFFLFCLCVCVFVCLSLPLSSPVASDSTLGSCHWPYQNWFYLSQCISHFFHLVCLSVYLSVLICLCVCVFVCLSLPLSSPVASDSTLGSCHWPYQNWFYLSQCISHFFHLVCLSVYLSVLICLCVCVFVCLFLPLSSPGCLRFYPRLLPLVTPKMILFVTVWLPFLSLCLSVYLSFCSVCVSACLPQALLVASDSTLGSCHWSHQKWSYLSEWLPFLSFCLSDYLSITSPSLCVSLSISKLYICLRL